MVATFTVTTIVCTVLLQWTGYAVTPADLVQGLSFSFPSPLAAGVALTALAMYAGTGIAWGEMCTYTYFASRRDTLASPEPTCRTRSGRGGLEGGSA